MTEQEEMKNKYRDRLKKIIGKKFDTTMIYPLSQFEAAFGELWGNGIDSERLTDEQKVMRAKWEKCRENILNNGNHQKRNSFAELDMHDVTWTRYKAVFMPVSNGNQRS